MKLKITTFIFVLLWSFSYAQQSVKTTVCFAPDAVHLPSSRWLRDWLDYKGTLAMKSVLKIYHIDMGAIPKYEAPRDDDPKYVKYDIYVPLVDSVILHAFAETGVLSIIPTGAWNPVRIRATSPPKTRWDELNVDADEIEAGQRELCRKMGVDFLITADIDPMTLIHLPSPDRKDRNKQVSVAQLEITLNVLRIDTTRAYYFSSPSLERRIFSHWDYGPDDASATKNLMDRIQRDVANWVNNTFRANIPVTKILSTNAANDALQIEAQVHGYDFLTNNKRKKISSFGVVELTPDSVFHHDCPNVIGKVKLLQKNENGADEFKVTDGGTAITQKMAQRKRLFLVPYYLIAYGYGLLPYDKGR
jgi:hypothetical protein